MSHVRWSGGAVMLACVTAAGAWAQQPPRDMVVSSDPELAALASSLLPDLAERASLTLNAPVRLEKRSRAQLVEYLEFKLDQEFPADEARTDVEALALLGLVPPDLDLREVLLGLYTEQVAGFYEPDSTALFVMDDQAQADLEGLLIHELVHAIQDQNADLSGLTDPEIGNDRALAAQAAIEGHATLVMIEYLVEEQLGVRLDPAMLRNFTEQLGPVLNASRAQFPALSGAPRVIQESVLFPYLEGAAFVQALWSGGERVAPFGESLPTSSEQILDRSVADPPVEVTLDVSGGSVVDADVLGSFVVGLLIEEHVGAAEAGVAEAWEGDRYALVEAADGTRGLVWYALWESAAARDRFADAFGPEPGSFDARATLERAEVGGRPATVLRVGGLDAVTVTARVADAP